MATLEQLEAALVKADASGNTDDARVFASEIRKMRQPSKKTPGSEPLSFSGMMQDTLGNMAQGAMRGGPMGAALAGGQSGLENMNKMVERGGYRMGEMATDALAPHVPAEVAGAGGYLANVATQALPVIAGSMIGSSARPVFEGAGKKVMQSALKPPVAELRSGNADRAVKTLLDEGVNVTQGGAEKLQGLVDDLDTTVTGLVDQAPGQVSKAYPASAISDTLEKFRTQVNPTSDVNAIMNSWDEFSKVYPDDIPVQLAHALKKGTYKALSGKYGEVGSAATEAQKSLARGLREGTAAAVPETSGLLKKEGDLLNALGLVERRAGVAGNRDLAGLASLAQNPKAAALMLADRSPLFKSLLARLLYSGAPTGATAAGAGAGAMYGYSGAEP